MEVNSSATCAPVDQSLRTVLFTIQGFYGILTVIIYILNIMALKQCRREFDITFYRIFTSKAVSSSIYWIIHYFPQRFVQLGYWCEVILSVFSEQTYIFTPYNVVAAYCPIFILTLNAAMALQRLSLVVAPYHAPEIWEKQFSKIIIVMMLVPLPFIWFVVPCKSFIMLVGGRPAIVYIKVFDISLYFTTAVAAVTLGFLTFACNVYIILRISCTELSQQLRGQTVVTVYVVLTMINTMIYALMQALLYYSIYSDYPNEILHRIMHVARPYVIDILVLPGAWMLPCISSQTRKFYTELLCKPSKTHVHAVSTVSLDTIFKTKAMKTNLSSCIIEDQAFCTIRYTIQGFYGTITVILYAVNIMALRHCLNEFDIIFYRLFTVNAVVSCIYWITHYSIQRYIELGYWCEELLEMFSQPTYMLNPYKTIVSYCPIAVLCLNLALAFERLIIVFSPQRALEIFEKYFIFIIIVTMLLPLTAMWFVIPCKSYVTISGGRTTITYKRIYRFSLAFTTSVAAIILGFMTFACNALIILKLSLSKAQHLRRQTTMTIFVVLTMLNTMIYALMQAVLYASKHMFTDQTLNRTVHLLRPYTIDILILPGAWMLPCASSQIRRFYSKLIWTILRRCGAPLIEDKTTNVRECTLGGKSFYERSTRK